MAAGGSTGSLSSLHVLLAEDNELNRIVATGILTRRGHRVTAARTGREAVDLSGRDHFDIALMDVQMPELDGLQATAAIRDRERAAAIGPTPRLPILALTAADTPADLRACLAAGMDGHVVKPLNPSALWSEIERVLGRMVEKRAIIDAPPAAGPVDQPLDLAALLEQAGGDHALLARLVVVYRQQSTELRAQLGRAVAGGDARAAHQQAHALKSVIGHWGQGPAFRLADRLESLGRDGDARALPPVYDELVSALIRLDHQLSQLTLLLGDRGVRA
jgi:two-component system sensor histidine kinase/response regulator